MSIRIFFVLLFSLSALQAQRQYSLTDAFPNQQSFVEPVYLTNAGDGSNRVFVVEQRGIIRVFENTPGVSSAPIFLDIESRVESGGEMGLLSVAFHPDYELNGYIYVNYTAPNPLRTVISRFTVNPPESNQADTSSEYIILEIDQPYSNHNGGLNKFGPDGYLYVGMGDGGSGGDPEGHGQNLSSLLGKMLRINVDSTQDSLNYAIPPDNPFAGNVQGYREEIWAYGLRNPWRFSFDSVTEWLYCGDVGQDKLEEIDLIWKGGNYGWNTMEGTKCYAASRCDTIGLKKPIKDYPRSKGQSVTGGYVYRGAAIPSLDGWYFYADFGSGLIWALQYDGTKVTRWKQMFKSGLNVSSFGIDEQNEMYIVSYSDGRIYRLVAALCPSFAPPRYRTLNADSALSLAAVKIKTRNGFLLAPPNNATAVEALFKKLRNKPTSFLGIKQIAMNDANQYAWVSYMKASELGKLYTTRHDTLYYPLDTVRGTVNTKMKKAVKASRTKFNNAAIEQGVAFRMNLLLSDSGITPPGFGDLILDTSVTLAGRQLKGRSLRSIAGYYDSVMTYWQLFGVNNPSAYAELRTFVETVLRPLNNAFASEILYAGTDYAVDDSLIKKSPFAIRLSGVRTASEAGFVKESSGFQLIMNNGGHSAGAFDFSVYPNPFNPSAVIRYSLQVKNFVAVKVYNALGQLVESLFEGEQETGTYSLEWNPVNKAAGIYFAGLTIAGESQVKKIVFLK